MLGETSRAAGGLVVDATDVHVCGQLCGGCKQLKGYLYTSESKTQLE